MSDTDVIVPIEIHSLLVTRAVNTADEFKRWTPQYSMMLKPDYKTSAEPTVQHSEGSPAEGVHVQWQLPEALTAGRIDPETGISEFPLVPNRWLVVRYADIESTKERKVAGFLVHSDYLQYADGPGGPKANTPFLDPTAPREAPKLDYIGRVHPLTAGPWTEPKRREPFLTAIGNGLPAFAAFATYHMNVFCFHDTLEDLKGNDNYPPPATVSYCVIGWYSEDGADILNRARQIPDLLPPGVDPTPANIASALGWLLPDDTSTDGLVRTRYAGTSLGIPWNRGGGHPESDRDGLDPKVAIGHSTADAASALVSRQASRRDGDLVRALFNGSPEVLDDPDGRVSSDEITRRSWFSGHDGGYTWHVVNRPHDGADPQAPPPEQPAWLDDLNADQAEYDAELPRVTSDQWRLWSLWWMSNLPEIRRPHEFPFVKAEWDAQIREVTATVAAGQAKLTTLRGRIPQGSNPEAFQRAVEQHAVREGLPAELELKRSVRQTFYRPADPVIALSGLGNGRPLTRDDDDPLPCRVASQLLTEVRINGTPVRPSATPLLPPNMTASIPEVCKALIAEFALFHQAFCTPASGSDPEKRALHVIVAEPGANSTGPWPEYTRVWRQPWLPLYIQWEAKYCATPYADDSGAPYWGFDGDERRYRWSGDGAAQGDGEGERRWTAFGNRAFITPTTQYVLREQARRQAQYAPAEVASRLDILRSELGDLDILSQTLDGFNDWLIQFDGMAQVATDPGILAAAGETNHVPDGAEDRRQQRFQPVRAGQFYFLELTVIDRFGRELRLVHPEQTQPIQFPLIRADSVTPDADLFPDAPGRQRFVQVPPRLLSPARVRLDAVRQSGDGVLSTTALLADTPVAGWLLVNDLDQTLLVYAPDGSPLGELRVVRNSSNTEIIAWNPLPHAPFRHPGDTAFRNAYPDIAGFALGLVGDGPAAPGPGPAALSALMESIDEAFDHIDEPAPAEDRSIARLIGRPVALVRADLGIDLQGRPLTDPGWDTILEATEDDAVYPDYGWTVKLGDPDRISDGLVGYFAGPAPGESIRYDTLRAVWPSSRSPYTAPIGGELVLPARPDDRPVTHRLTLLVCPHTAVHATTDILPVTELRLDADTTHQAMARIRASFRLNPLLAPGYVDTGEEDEARDGAPLPEPGLVMPRPAAWHGQWTWAEPVAVDGSDLPDWDELVIQLADDLSHPDAPVPAARAGYLQLLPRGRSQPADPSGKGATR
ncbi:hypothetical protein ABH920_001390 [Catenulispora sp. EB89]|uniref:hypothetical protein n=1 Tax=Catenulispora sp. EB89 TaxID=3156257 RepID=UPI003514750C